MANPASPRETNDTTGTKLGYGIYDQSATGVAAFWRILNASVVSAETHRSGSLAVASMTLHDVADPSAEGPVKIGGFARATAPADVSADADRVNAWFLRNGAQAVVPVGGGGLAGILDDAAFTPGSSGVVMAGFAADETATDSVDEGDGGAARMTLDRKQITTPQPHTAGGLSTFNGTTSDGGAGAPGITSTAVAVKASAGQVYGWYIFNPNDEVSFVNIYDVAAGGVTVGTTNPLFQIPVPPGAAANLSGTHGITFGTAISVSATKTAGSATAPDVVMEVVLFYK